MSKKNGDKARFGKEQKKKLLRRKRNLALRQSLANPSVRPVQAVIPSPEATVTNTGAADAIL